MRMRITVVLLLTLGLAFPGLRAQAQQVNAAITKQITNLDQPTTGTIELGTLTWPPARLQYLGLETPPGFTVEGMSPDSSGCTDTSQRCWQYWKWTIAANQNCTWDGQYKAKFNVICPPGAKDCTPRPHEVAFKLKSENFCREQTVDVLAKVEWEGFPGCAKDIGAGPSGHIWAVGCSASATGGGNQTYMSNGKEWKFMPGGSVRLAVDPKGYAWTVNDKGQILRWHSGGGRLVEGCARDIGIGANGATWVIGCNAARGGGGYEIFYYSGGKWNKVEGGAVRIAVAPDGTPWVANDRGNLYKWNGRNFDQVAGCAKDIGIGQDGVVWHIGCNAVPGGFGIYRWKGNGWENVPGGAVAITVAGVNQPYVVNSAGQIFRAKAQAR